MEEKFMVVEGEIRVLLSSKPFYFKLMFWTRTKLKDRDKNTFKLQGSWPAGLRMWQVLNRLFKFTHMLLFHNHKFCFFSEASLTVELPHQYTVITMLQYSSKY